MKIIFDNFVILVLGEGVFKKGEKKEPEIFESQASGLKFNSKSTAISMNESSNTLDDKNLLDLDISIIPHQKKYNFDTF